MSNYNHTLSERLFKKNFLIFFASFFLLLLPLSVPALAAEKEESDSLLDDARFEVGYVTGEFIGLKEGYLDLGVFVPIFECGDFVSFVDAKGYRFENSRWGASAGLGMRTWCLNECILGSNIYYDYLEGRFHNFNRMGAGLECLTPCFDVRVNGYFPILDTEHRSRIHCFDDFQGDFIALSRNREFTPRVGFDMELGLPIGCWWDSLSIYCAAGPYYYNWRHKKNYWGGQARLELYWKSYVTVQVQTSYDRVNHSRTEGKFLLFIPFNVIDLLSGGECCENLCKALFYQPVVRNGTIFTDHCCSFCWNWDSDGMLNNH